MSIMKIREVINQLKEIEKTNPEVELCVFDWRKNAANCSGPDDPLSIGIHSDFTIELIPQRYRPEGSTDWVAMSFENDDYETVSSE